MRIARTFARAKQESRGVLVTYVMAGDPSLERSADAALACIRGGADIVELGFPFSDPIADGPTIQRAAERSLAGGTTLASVIKMAQALRRQTEVPLVLMGYLNPVLAMGIEPFFASASVAGIDGVILPDLPPEEAGDLRAQAQRTGVSIISMLAPTSTPARRAAVLSVASGFTYFVSVTGVTGTRAERADISAPLASIRAESNLPVVVGFGIGNAEQARAAASHADGVVVGSAIVERLARGEPLEPFVATLRAALSSLS